MRKSILGAFIGLVLASLYVWADSTTTNFGFVLPTIGSAGWGPKISSNFVTLDGAVPGIKLDNAFEGDNTFGGNVVVSTISLSQLKIGTATYSGSDRMGVNGQATFFGPTGAVVRLCDANATNCTNMNIETSNPTKGIVSTTQTISGLLTAPTINSTAIKISTTTDITGVWISNSSNTLTPYYINELNVRETANIGKTGTGIGSITFGDNTMQTTAFIGVTSGITVYPATATASFPYGLSATTAAVTQTNTGSINAVTITSTGTGKALYIVPQGKAGNAYQDQVGAVTIEKLSGVPTEFLVIHDSTTSNQLGTGLLEIWEDQGGSAGHNDPLLWIHNNGSASNPFMRVDDYAPDMEIVNLSTNNAVGLGKWEPFAMANGGVDLQINSRAFDNSTFENVAYWHPLQKGDAIPGLYLRSQTLANDSGVLSSSDTTGVTFFTLDAHTVGLTGPQSATASYTFALPSTVGATGEVLYHAGNRGGNFSARKMEWSGTDFLYAPATGVTISTITVSSATFSKLTVSTITTSYIQDLSLNALLFRPPADPTSVFVGTNGGALGITGTQSTALGYNSYLQGNNGSNNTSVGYLSQTLNAGSSNNTSVGHDSLSTLVNSASDNTAVGYRAGRNELGPQNVYIGSGSGPSSSKTLTNSIAIGYNAVVATSNTVVIGNTSISSTSLNGNVYVSTMTVGGTQYPSTQISMTKVPGSGYLVYAATSPTTTQSMFSISDQNTMNLGYCGGGGTQITLKNGTYAGSCYSNNVELGNSGHFSPTFQVRAANGVSISNFSNVPRQLYAKWLEIGPNYGDWTSLGGVGVDTNQSAAFEGSVQIGTSSLTSASLVVKGSSTFSNAFELKDTSGSSYLTASNSGVTTISSTTLTGYLGYSSRTLSQLQAMATSAGQAFYCSNCTTDTVCVATGTINSFVRMSARTTACN